MAANAAAAAAAAAGGGGGGGVGHNRNNAGNSAEHIEFCVKAEEDLFLNGTEVSKEMR
jgi:hypothetical protein